MWDFQFFAAEILRISSQSGFASRNPHGGARKVLSFALIYVGTRSWEFLTLALTSVWCFSVQTYAQDALWSPPLSNSDNWNDARNWNPGIPTGTATFDTSDVTAIALQGTVTIGTLQFNVTAPAYTFNNLGTLEITGFGVVNQSANNPVFTNSDLGAAIHFNNGSSAGNAVIMNDASTGGSTTFLNTSTAGRATITTTNNSMVIFADASTGGSGRFINQANGVFDMSSLTSGMMTVGSIEGAGTFFLGSSALTVGLNNISTTVTGTIVDGGLNGGVGGSLVKVGTGTLMLTGLNTYSGGTSMNGGSIAVQSDSNLGTGPLSFDGGTLEAVGFGGFVITGKPVTLNAGGGTFSADFGTTDAFNGTISGPGALTMIGRGTLILSGLNTYRGGTNINGENFLNSLQGEIAVSSDSNLGAGPIRFNGGTLEVLTRGGGITSNKAIILFESGGTIQTDSGTTSTLRGSITGQGSLLFNTFGFIKNGPGTLMLSGVNAYSGYITVNEGTLIVGSSTALSPTGGLAVFGVVDLNGFNSTVAAFGGDGTVTNNGATAVNLTIRPSSSHLPATTFFGNLMDGTSALKLTVSGPSALNLVGNNTYSGGTNIDGGALVGAGGGANLGTGQIRFDNGELLLGGLESVLTLDNPILLSVGGGTLDLPQLATLTFTGQITGTGALTAFGKGSIILTTANTYSGGTNIELGTIEVTTDSNLGTGPLTFDGGTLKALTAGGGIISNKAIFLDSGGGTFLADAATTSILSGTMSGPGSFTKDGPGTLIVAGFNTYAGPTNVLMGTLKAGSLTGFSPNSAFTVTSLVDLNGFSNTIGALSGTGTITNNGMPPANLTVDVEDADTTFSGILSNGTGILQVKKTGTGTLVLSGTSTYTGATQVVDGFLKAGSTTAFSSASAFTVNAVLDLGGFSNTIGSLAGHGAVTNKGSGPAVLSAGANGTSTRFSGVLMDGSSSLALAKVGLGALLLSGANTYTGGTIVSAGTLTVDGAQSLGLGNVVVNGGILNADPQPINVRGNYTQNAEGTLQLNIAGANHGQYDSLVVSGNANLAGTLQLLSLGFVPKAGNQLTLVSTGGAVAGKFGKVLNPFTAGAGFNTVELIYEPKLVLLEFLNLAMPAPPPGSPIIPISISVAEVSPAGLTAAFDIGFSNADIERLNLEDRLDALRAGCSGFSSNMKLNGTSTNPGGKEVLDEKSSLSTPQIIVAPGCLEWGLWITGSGDFVNVDGDADAKRYNYTTGAVTLGLDYRLTDHLAVGVMGEYSHTWTGLEPIGHIDVDSGRGGLYGTWYEHGLYVNGGIVAGHNTYDTSRSNAGGLSTGSTEGSEWSAFIGAGYDYHFGSLSVGPIGSLQYTSVNLNGFTERGSLLPLDIHSESAESLRSDLGLRASYRWQIRNIMVRPVLKAAWEHEYKYSAFPITAGFADFSVPAVTFYGSKQGQNSAVISAGASAQLTPALSVYVNYDGQLGREHYDSNAVTGGIAINF
jgi:outer membrane autotransporter protein